MVYDVGPNGYAGGLLTSRFYLVLVDMWHAGYESMPMEVCFNIYFTSFTIYSTYSNYYFTYED